MAIEKSLLNFRIQWLKLDEDRNLSDDTSPKSYQDYLDLVETLIQRVTLLSKQETESWSMEIRESMADLNKHIRSHNQTSKK